ncbi:MAG: DUF3737 family protein [Oscillospiraceae bacterium]|nr:DUF3737 family protein [Oscillospiraceae bacterium]
MKIQNMTYDEERALYNLQDATVMDCRFEGPADGESALKEARNVKIRNCKFSLRYPLWHTSGFTLDSCEMTDTCRAALWYAEGGNISGSKLDGIKCLRECRDVTLANTEVTSEEFGWKCRGIQVADCDITSQYIFLDSCDLQLDRLQMQGKYSFQYTENVTITDSRLDTKDAFWHAKNVTVKNSWVKGEYLGWYSDGLTLIGCHIIGTQPLCYCKNLTLIDCTMEDTDLSFEYSQVEATVTGHIDSVKNPASGHILADSIGQVILEDAVMETNCHIAVR